MKAKPDDLWAFRERPLSRLKRRTSLTGSPSLCGTLSHSLPRSVFEKPPLGTLKNFFKCVKAKPDCLSVFRAGTLSRLHESTKHPQRGRRPESIDRFPEIHCSGIPDSYPSIKSMFPAHRKSFRIDPFFKGGRRVQGGALQRKQGAGQEVLRGALGAGGIGKKRMFAP